MSADSESTHVGASTIKWTPDVLPEHEACTLELAGVTPEWEEFSTPVATLVRRIIPAGQEPRPAVLYVHGWNDYFFQSWLSEFFDQQGYDFYAIDLRRYGRSLRPGQYGGYIADMAEYDQELDMAREIIKQAQHPTILIHGHSTGGLVVVGHVSRRVGEYSAVILNSPWLDLSNQPLLRTLSMGIDAVGAWLPTSVIPGSAPIFDEDGVVDRGFYARSIHNDWDGEWNYNLDWKSNPELFTYRYGWARAIIRAQQAVYAGFNLGCPLAVFASTASAAPKEYDLDICWSADLVLDVNTMVQQAAGLSDNVTIVRIKDGLHDLALSRKPARSTYFSAIAKWLETLAS
ncbi:MAG: alpha/beta hydrolase [Propionibacteriaceae bacterium]